MTAFLPHHPIADFLQSFDKVLAADLR